MPKPSERAKEMFSAIVPAEPSITLRPMFGNLAAFVNGNMFTGLFGEDLFVRLSDEEQARVLKEGGKAFEPMPGHAMKGYVCVASTWQRDPVKTRAWVGRSLDWSRKLPAKKPKGRAF
ncbi:MAG: TfoX/Sxy family protein [Chloroflexi bacterium]|nr:MAG: TfoX/Sxy family protein [Chloroflexota bacterium]